MKLLFAGTYGHLPDVVGGLQTTLHELCAGLAARGHEVRYLCGFVGAPDGVAQVARADEMAGYTVIRLPNPAEAIATVAAVFAPDAVVVNTGSPTLPLLLSAMNTGIPLALYIHNVEYRELGGPLLPDPSILYLANSPFSRDRMRALFGIECEVLKPYVERESYRGETDPRHVLFVNPTLPKGVEIAFAIAERMPDVRFRFVESWRLGRSWREYCATRAAAAGNIEWSRATDRPDELFRGTSVLLMPSVWEETFGRSITEAQLAGIPVLASNRGGLPDTVGEGGVVIDPHDPPELWVEALDSMIADETWYRELGGLALAQAMADETAPDTTIRRLLSMLDEHVANAARG